MKAGFIKIAPWWPLRIFFKFIKMPPSTGVSAYMVSKGSPFYPHQPIALCMFNSDKFKGDKVEYFWQVHMSVENVRGVAKQLNEMADRCETFRPETMGNVEGENT